MIINFQYVQVSYSMFFIKHNGDFVSFFYIVFKMYYASKVIICIYLKALIFNAVLS